MKKPVEWLEQLAVAVSEDMFIPTKPPGQRTEKIVRLIQSDCVGGLVKGHQLFYVHQNSGGAIFVKEREFAENQGVLIEEWGKSWKPVMAANLSHAREIAAVLFEKRLL